MKYFIISFLFLNVIVFPKEMFAKSNLLNCVSINNKLVFEDCDLTNTCHCKAKSNFGDGRIYDGEWHLNRPYGKGTMTYEDGRRYVGRWKSTDGNINNVIGKGLIFYENGLQYIGGWGMTGDKSGWGLMVNENGNEYIGEWQFDNKQGQGKMIYFDGFQFIGKWENNEPSNGRSTLIYTNGKKISAYFSYGIFGFGYYKLDSILNLWDFVLFWYYKINNQR